MFYASGIPKIKFYVAISEAFLIFNTMFEVLVLFVANMRNITIYNYFVFFINLVSIE